VELGHYISNLWARQLVHIQALSGLSALYQQVSITSYSWWQEWMEKILLCHWLAAQRHARSCFSIMATLVDKWGGEGKIWESEGTSFLRKEKAFRYGAFVFKRCNNIRYDGHSTSSIPLISGMTYMPPTVLFYSMYIASLIQNWTFLLFDTVLDDHSMCITSLIQNWTMQPYLDATCPPTALT
jgi:hypothetical protein